MTLVNLPKVPRAEGRFKKQKIPKYLCPYKLDDTLCCYIQSRERIVYQMMFQMT